MKYAITIAVALALTAGTAFAQTRFIPLDEFKPDRNTVHKKVDTAKQNRCRGHAAPFKHRAVDVPPWKRPYSLAFWRYRLNVARDKSNRCFAVRMWRWFNISGAACVKAHEGAWSSNTGNGYYGGFQADTSFQDAYGREYYRPYADKTKTRTANNWAPLYQIHMAYRGWSARGWYPWPNTAAACGLL